MSSPDPSSAPWTITAARKEPTLRAAADFPAAAASALAAAGHMAMVPFAVTAGHMAIVPFAAAAEHMVMVRAAAAQAAAIVLMTEAARTCSASPARVPASPSPASADKISQTPCDPIGFYQSEPPYQHSAEPDSLLPATAKGDTPCHSGYLDYSGCSQSSAPSRPAAVRLCFNILPVFHESQNTFSPKHHYIIDKKGKSTENHTAQKHADRLVEQIDPDRPAAYRG